MPEVDYGVAERPLAALSVGLTRRQFLRLLLLLPGGCAGQPLMGGESPLPTPTPVPSPTPAPTIPTPTPTPTPLPQQFSGTLALAHAAAQMQYVPRHTGTEGWRLCGDYILAQLAAQGWSTEEQPFRYMETDCRNLIGKKGSGPPLVIGAHYDSRRRADQDPDPDKRSLPVPAANDGASGVAVLLELARVLRPDALGRTIWLVAFDAEDNGGLDGWDWIAGSRHFVRVLTSPLQGMVLVDMIGDADQQIYYEGNSHEALRKGIWTVADSLSYDTFVPEVRHTMLDDHIPFVQAGIPAVDLIDFDYPYWHTTQDTLDKISAESLDAVGRTLEAWLVRGAPGLPPFSASYRIHMPRIIG
jgi:glutaminyl-peptide cyclotransferase